MALKKSLLIAGAVSTIGLATLAGANAATAATGQDSLVEKIATKFNLNKDEVATVFEEYKNEKQAERQAEVSEGLQDKVDDGDITAEQKTLIENKQDELKEKREASRDSLEQWADDNNLDLKDIMPLGGGQGHGGPGGMMH